MKKELIFAPILLVVGILLGLLRATGLTVHIIISVVGAVVLVLYTIATKKNWKLPAVEITMRGAYGIALISGILLRIKYLSVFAIIHKITAVLFLVLLIVLFVYKLIKDKRK